VVFRRAADGAVVFDSKKTLKQHARRDFGRMKPKWYIEVRRFGALDMSVVLHDFDENGACVEVATGVDFEQAGRIDLGAVDPDAFVRGESRLLGSAGQLTLAVVDAEDGAVAPLWLFDVAIEAQCEFWHDPLGTVCYPMRRAWLDGEFYWDDACTEPASVAYESTARECDDVDYLIDPFASDGEPLLYQVGEEATAEVWTGISDCTSRYEAPWMEYLVTVGEAVTVEAATLTGIRLGDGRLEAVAVGEGEIPMLLSVSQYWDTALGTYCQPREVNGELRCLPGIQTSWASAWGQYADPACSELLVYCATGSCEETLLYETDDVEGSCGGDNYTSLKRLAEQVTGEVYELQDSNCVGPVEPFAVWTWEDIDPSAFGSLELVTEQ
jgi:hypothetical protein